MFSSLFCSLSYVSLWSEATLAMREIVGPNPSAKISQSVWGPLNKYIVSACEDGRVYIHDPEVWLELLYGNNLSRLLSVMAFWQWLVWRIDTHNRWSCRPCEQRFVFLWRAFLYHYIWRPHCQSISLFPPYELLVDFFPFSLSSPTQILHTFSLSALIAALWQPHFQAAQDLWNRKTCELSIHFPHYGSRMSFLLASPLSNAIARSRNSFFCLFGGKLILLLPSS